MRWKTYLLAIGLFIDCSINFVFLWTNKIIKFPNDYFVRWLLNVPVFGYGERDRENVGENTFFLSVKLKWKVLYAISIHTPNSLHYFFCLIFCFVSYFNLAWCTYLCFFNPWKWSNSICLHVNHHHRKKSSKTMLIHQTTKKKLKTKLFLIKFFLNDCVVWWLLRMDGGQRRNVHIDIVTICEFFMIKSKIHWNQSEITVSPFVYLIFLLYLHS